MVDQSAVGRTFAPVTARVEPGRLRFFLDTLGDTNPVYRDGAGRAAGGGVLKKAAAAPARRGGGGGGSGAAGGAAGGAPGGPGFPAARWPPTYLFCLEMMDAPDPFEFLTALDIDLARVLHGEQRFDYHAPVVVGDTLTLTSRVTEVTDKKGGAMTLIVIVTAVTNQSGIHVADTSRTVVVRNSRPS